MVRSAQSSHPPHQVRPDPPTDAFLIDLFRDVRDVLDVRVAIDRRTSQPRGFAHADFTDTTAATRAKALLEGRVIYGRQLRVDFSAHASTTREAPHSGRE